MIRSSRPLVKPAPVAKVAILRMFIAPPTEASPMANWGFLKIGGIPLVIIHLHPVSMGFSIEIPIKIHKNHLFGGYPH